MDTLLVAHATCLLLEAAMGWARWMTWWLLWESVEATCVQGKVEDMEEMRVLRKYFSFLNLSSRDVADIASLLYFGSTMQGEMEGATAKKAWGYCYWWKSSQCNWDFSRGQVVAELSLLFSTS